MGGGGGALGGLFLSFLKGWNMGKKEGRGEEEGKKGETRKR